MTPDVFDKTSKVGRIRTLSPCLTKVSLGVLAGLIVCAMVPDAAKAQSVRPCGNGPYEQQVGQTTSGGVVVPLCVDTTPPAPNSGGTTPKSRADYFTGDGTVSLPRGWRQSYGLFRNVAIATDPTTGNTVYDYIVSVGHQTPDDAREGLRRECLARTDLLWPETDCTGDGTLIQMPFVSVIYYPDDPYWGSQRARFEVYSGSRPGPQGAVPSASGGRDYCFQSGLPAEKCGQPVRHLVNGEIAADAPGRRR